MMSFLAYARLAHPCSKSNTYEEVIPKLFNTYDCIMVWNTLDANTNLTRAINFIKEFASLTGLPLMRLPFPEDALKNRCLQIIMY